MILTLTFKVKAHSFIIIWDTIARKTLFQRYHCTYLIEITKIKRSLNRYMYANLPIKFNEERLLKNMQSSKFKIVVSRTI